MLDPVAVNNDHGGILSTLMSVAQLDAVAVNQRRLMSGQRSFQNAS